MREIAMRRFLTVLLIPSLVLSIGCEEPLAARTATPEPKAEKVDKDPKDAGQPEPLPELPKAEAKSVMTALNKEKTLYLEKKPDGTMRVLFAAEVCQREKNIFLEVFACKKNTKEHEAIVRVDLDARFIHAAMVAAGAKVGKPVQFVNPKSKEPEYKPASGDKIVVSVHYSLAGKLHTHPAQEWILDKKTKKPMAHDWVFAGSRFVKNPDAPATDPEYYCANNGEVIAISNFIDSMLDIPVEISKDEADLHFAPVTDKIPPVKSMIWVIMEVKK